ncbi:hypothetical protein [Nocardioides sp. W7]|uniref:hypothetical protein n=1 Tax=Nocardioides sp. W7 TaxID=2931390 RepID=UPI001FD5448E|nr:hypothetical protein [Nocardioides sp. W7]
MNDFEDRLRRHVDALTPEQSVPFREVLARRDRRRRRHRALAASGTAMVAVAAIAIGTQPLGPDHPQDSGGPATSSPAPTETETERPEPTYEWGEQPSPVVLRLASRDLALKPSSYCWTGPPNRKGISRSICPYGMEQTRDLPGVGSPAALDFWFGVEDWRFEATFTELGVDCPRQHTVPVTRTGDHLFHLDPVGPAGRYSVNLFGSGDQGSVRASFLWATPSDGPADQPSAYVALASEAGELETHPVEVGVDDLAFQPREADVEVTVTAANGRSMTLDAEGRDHGECYAEGTLFFRGEQDQAQQAAQLGPPPFTYQVRLTLDGRRYLGTAVWPRDEIADLAPNTALTFDPPLPAYAAP